MRQVLIERTPSRIDAIRAYRRQNCELLVTHPLCKTRQFREEYGYEEEGNRTVSYQPIENYGIIGNMRTIALVGMNGSIDWYCYPHFDSPSVFGAILDDKKGGRFQLSAASDGVRHKQFYWPSTNVLVTRFLMADGIAELEDSMPVGLPSNSPEYRHVYRRIRCVRGTVRMSLACRPAFDYGRQTHEALIGTNGATFKSGGLILALSSAVPLKNDGHGGVSAKFILSEGE